MCRHGRYNHGTGSLGFAVLRDPGEPGRELAMPSSPCEPRRVPHELCESGREVFTAVGNSVLSANRGYFLSDVAGLEPFAEDRVRVVDDDEGLRVDDSDVEY